MEEFDPGTGTVKGFSLSFEADDPAFPTKWVIKATITLEKVDSSGTFEQSNSRTKITIHYKTSTISLSH